MVTQLLDRVPLERVQAEARQVHLGRLLLTLLVGVFWLLGWAAGMVSLAVGFAFAAMKVGWQDARGSREVRSRAGPA
jgi:hypothetical protein